jgi:hypothetical protein
MCGTGHGTGVLYPVMGASIELASTKGQFVYFSGTFGQRALSHPRPPRPLGRTFGAELAPFPCRGAPENAQ